MSATTGWAEPSDLIVQTAFGDSVESRTMQGDWQSLSLKADEFRQLLDIGNISGGTGDDYLGITESGQFRLFPSTYSRPSSNYLVIGWGWQTYNQVVVVGDLNGDGRADLMARDTHGKLWFYGSRNSLTQPFLPRVQVGYGWNTYDQIIGAANFNGTAPGSLIARDLQGHLWRYDGRSDGTLAPRQQIGTGWKGYNQLLGLDYNGDGHGDIIARTESGDLYSYAGNGTGGYADPVKAGTGWASVNAIANEGHQPDFGKGVIFGRYSNGDGYWYVGQGNGKLSQAELGASGYILSTWPLMSTTVSLDNQGIPGLVAVGGDVLLNLCVVNNTSPVVDYNVVIGPGDLNSDGKADLIARNPSGHLWFIPGNGAGSTNGTPVSLGGGWNAYNHIVGAGDLTGDGIPDILATTPGGSLYLYPGLGNGRFGSKKYIGWSWQMYPKIAAPGDLTGDGKADLVAVDSAGRLWLYPGLGNDTFGKRTEIGTSGWNHFHDIS